MHAQISCQWQLATQLRLSESKAQSIVDMLASHENRLKCNLENWLPAYLLLTASKSRPICAATAVPKRMHLIAVMISAAKACNHSGY